MLHPETRIAADESVVSGNHADPGRTMPPGLEGIAFKINPDAVAPLVHEAHDACREILRLAASEGVNQSVPTELPVLAATLAMTGHFLDRVAPIKGGALWTDVIVADCQASLEPSESAGA